MCIFSEYKDFFGKSGKGVHGYRFLKDTAILDYFVGVVKSNKTPVEKKIIPLSLPFEAKSVSTFSLEEPISIVIKLQPGEEISAYSIFIGFQLNKDQLLFNRERLKALRE